MSRVMVCVISLSIIIQGIAFKQSYARDVVSILTVSNGGGWGDWHDPEFCPEGTYASGYKMKIEPNQDDADDTSLNAISLQCEDEDRKYGGQVQSGSGDWGIWLELSSCTFQNGTQDFLTDFTLQVEPSQGGNRDDTAANFVKFFCRDLKGKRGQYIVVYPCMNGMWGSYGRWSGSCPINSAICGIQTRIEADQGPDGDDTALNDVKFFCCK